MRGHKAKVGDVNVSQNGYHYTCTETGWRLTHHIILEEKLGRPLKEYESAIFVDGNRRNLDPSNIEVREKTKGALQRRQRALKANIAKLQAELTEITNELRVY